MAIGPGPGLSALAVAAAATYPLDHFDLLAVLILTLEAEIYPSVVAAVRPLVIRAEVVPEMGYTSLVHSPLSFLWAGLRGVSAPAGPSLYTTPSL